MRSGRSGRSGRTLSFATPWRRNTLQSSRELLGGGGAQGHSWMGTLRNLRTSIGPIGA